MDVFVHPSWAEAFPYVILEAMSLARAIVASDVGGIGEAIVNRESGILTPPRDERALAQALIALLDDPSTATRIGQGARLRVAQFTPEAMIAGLTATYREIVRSAPAASLVPAAERGSLQGRD
jgi:glycosyltransferase involved in cell wall biosynthesis